MLVYLAQCPHGLSSSRMDVELMAIIRTLNRFGYHPITSSTFGRLPQDNLSLIFIQTSAPSTLFGIRFNKLSLRVIDLPQNQAPGVLSVVRSAWPLGIASEEQKADNVYEFSLKGHGCESGTTFLYIVAPLSSVPSVSPDSNHDRDSLTLVLNLLSGLPAQFCNLVMSVSLNRKMARSETRDFWLFEGLPPIRPPPLQIAQTYSMGARGAPLRYPVSRSTETLMPPAGSDEASDIVNHCGLVY